MDREVQILPHILNLILYVNSGNVIEFKGHPLSPVSLSIGMTLSGVQTRVQTGVQITTDSPTTCIFMFMQF